MVTSDRPGREIDKEYAAIVVDLIDNQGWRYDKGTGGYPKLWPADKSKRVIPIPKTPSPNFLKAWKAQVKRAGGDLSTTRKQ